MDAIADSIFDALLKVFKYPEIVVALIAVIPIVEARLAIPIAMRYAISPFSSWMLAFVGSSLIVPILLVVLIPFIKWLAKTKLFKKVGQTIYEKFEKKTDGIKDGEGEKKTDFKKMLAIFLFVAIPLPLTGVWTGCAVASLTGLKFHKSLISIILGNLVASGIITLLCVFFEPYIDYIILALTVIAVVVVIALIVKIILHKSKDENNTTPDIKKEN